MSDDDFFELLKFIYSEKISEIRTSTENNDFIVLEDENYYVEEKDIIKAYLEDIKEKYEEFDKKMKNESRELIDEYLKVAVRESLLYSRFGFSFLDTVQEATLGVITALNYYDKISLMNQALTSVNLSYIDLKQPIFELSGGEAQRVALAKIILKNPPIILADEPTASLDPENSKELLSILESLKNQNRTIIIATHNPVIWEKVDEVIRVNDFSQLT